MPDLAKLLPCFSMLFKTANQAFMKPGICLFPKVVIEDGPSPQKTTFRKLAANAPVEVVIRKYRCAF